MAKKQLKGIVISNKMQKTVVVKIERIKEHPKYKRRYKVFKKYKAHEEKGECLVGDRVVIEECIPISKEKKWKVIERTAVNNQEEIVDTAEDSLGSSEQKTEEKI